MPDFRAEKAETAISARKQAQLNLSVRQRVNLAAIEHGPYLLELQDAASGDLSSIAASSLEGEITALCLQLRRLHGLAVKVQSLPYTLRLIDVLAFGSLAES